ncbi:hypothetical protein Tco_0792371 [Tanacetum coccineum]
MDLFTHDIQGAKTYEEYENEWFYKLNNDVPWDAAEPWLENRVPYELTDHICEPFHFRNGKTIWPTCNLNKDGFCNGGELPGMVRVGYMTYFHDYKWYDDLIDVNLKEEALKNYIHGTYANTNIDVNYNTYLDVSRIFNNRAGRNDEEAIKEEREPNDNHGISNFDNDLVLDNTPHHANEEEEPYEKDRCELLGNLCQEPSVYKIGRFEVIKYSFGPVEKYIAIKECKHDDWTRTEEDACHAHQGIFRIIDEGWFVTRAELRAEDKSNLKT